MRWTWELLTAGLLLAGRAGAAELPEVLPEKPGPDGTPALPTADPAGPGKAVYVSNGADADSVPSDCPCKRLGRPHPGARRTACGHRFLDWLCYRQLVRTNYCHWGKPCYPCNPPPLYTFFLFPHCAETVVQAGGQVVMPIGPACCGRR